MWLISRSQAVDAQEEEVVLSTIFTKPIFFYLRAVPLLIFVYVPLISTELITVRRVDLQTMRLQIWKM